MKHISIRIVFFLLFAFELTSFAQINWTKYASNPVFSDTTGGWTSAIAYSPTILLINNTYHMWYTGNDGIYSRIGYATSIDGFTWVPCDSNPVLNVGQPGSYESSAVTEPWVIYDGSMFHMWYTGINKESSTWKDAIGYATSLDGINWTKYSDQPVLKKGLAGSWDDLEVFLGSVIFDGSTYHMWYSGAKVGTGSIRNTGYATSSDGANWTKYAHNPVLTTGPSNFWDYPRVAQAKVVFDGVKYHMFYSGNDWFQWRIGYASALDETTWTKYGDYPVLDVGNPGEWDDYYVGVPAVVIDTADSVFRMWYTGGIQAGDAHIGYAYSTITNGIDNIQNIIPQNIILKQNYPNPFNPSTTIEFSIPKTEFVTLKIYNLLGQEVSELVSKKLTHGNYKYIWDASQFASGIYFYKLVVDSYGEAASFIQTKKLILMK